jgi:hypothetical protein
MSTDVFVHRTISMFVSIRSVCDRCCWLKNAEVNKQALSLTQSMSSIDSDTVCSVIRSMLPHVWNPMDNR